MIGFGPGQYVTPDLQPGSHIRDALVFETADQAAGWIAQYAPEHSLVVRFHAVALAEHDQWEAAWLDDGTS